MSTMSDERIQPALHALLLSDAGGLQSVLTDDPEMVHATWNGNTLLEWATQPPHGIGPDCIAVLIESGASLDRALGLAGCFNLAEVCTQLLDAGADPTSVESDVSPITPLESATMHGSTASADVLVEHGLHRPTLWLAAATGQVDLVTGRPMRHMYSPGLASAIFSSSTARSRSRLESSWIQGMASVPPAGDHR